MDLDIEKMQADYEKFKASLERQVSGLNSLML